MHGVVGVEALGPVPNVHKVWTLPLDGRAEFSSPRRRRMHGRAGSGDQAHSSITGELGRWPWLRVQHGVEPVAIAQRRSEFDCVVLRSADVEPVGKDKDLHVRSQAPTTVSSWSAGARPISSASRRARASHVCWAANARRSAMSA